MLTYPNINPVIVHIYGPLAIRWYSLAYVLGILYVVNFLKKYGSKFHILKKTEVDDFIPFGIIGLIAGARMFHVFIYDWDYYINHKTEILQTWQGGLSFYGGIVGLFISTYLFGKIYKLNSLRIFDLGIVAAPMGLFFGRIANFINGELYGKSCVNHLFCIIFPNDIMQIPRHPTQLYEATFEGLFLFIIMNILFKYSKFIHHTGKLTGIFCIFYSIFRFIIEFFKEADNNLGLILFDITIGQLLSIILFIFGIILVFFNRKSHSIFN